MVWFFRESVFAVYPIAIDGLTIEHPLLKRKKQLTPTGCVEDVEK
jgi:hypothetical protein